MLGVYKRMLSHYNRRTVSFFAILWHKKVISCCWCWLAIWHDEWRLYSHAILPTLPYLDLISCQLNFLLVCQLHIYPENQNTYGHIVRFNVNTNVFFLMLKNLRPLMWLRSICCWTQFIIQAYTKFLKLYGAALCIINALPTLSRHKNYVHQNRTLNASSDRYLNGL